MYVIFIFYVIFIDMFSLNRWSQLAGLFSLNEVDERDVRLKASIEGFAVGQIDVHGDITIVLYDPSKMKAAVEELEDPKKTTKSPTGMMHTAIAGMIRISPPAYGQTNDESSCRGAWEVVRSGVRQQGAGVGGLLYRLAAAASPTGKLMPDRRDVSGKAQNVWKSKFDRMSPNKRKANVLDDETNTRTEDPNDDCIVHDYDEKEGPGSNMLNYVYDDFGGKVDVSALESAHRDFMDEISWSLPPGLDINKLFYKAASNAFHEMTD